MVNMRPKSTKDDLPSTHEIGNYIHNEFCTFMEETKAAIIVSFMFSQSGVEGFHEKL